MGLLFNFDIDSRIMGPGVGFGFAHSNWAFESPA